MITRQHKFFEIVKELKTKSFLDATSQLCHMDTGLAERCWLELYPRLWSILSDKQREALAGELVPFVCSGSHVIQKDCHPSSLNTFLEAISRCQPGVAIPASVLKYLGKSHNLWHRAALLLEQQAFDPSPRDVIKTKKEAIPSIIDQSEVFDFDPGPSTSN